MPAKKKQSTTSAAPRSEDEEIAQLSEMMQQAMMEQQGGSKQEKKEQQKQMNKLMAQVREQQQQYYKQRLLQQQYQEYSLMQEMLVANRTQHPVNDVPLEAVYTKWTELAPGKWIRYQQFTPEYMEQVMKMFAEELPEPYSVFTYEHFLSGWPCLGLLLFGHEGAAAPETATEGGQLIGSIVSRVTFNPNHGNQRGYIAMLAVRPNWRGHRLGQKLVKVTVELMRKHKAEEVVLETPISNERALKLYTEMGFVKTKFLTRYYLDGSDAFRLKLWLSNPRQQ